MSELTAKGTEEKKTLKRSLSQLNQRNIELEELKNLSEALLNKFVNPNNHPTEKDDISSKEMEPDTLVDVFDAVARKMGHHIDFINKNITLVLNMID